MSEIRARRIKVGAFIAVAIGALVAGVVILGGLRWWKDYDHYWIGYSSSVTGLEAGSAVKVRGVRVGEVVDVELVDDPEDPVRVTVRVEAGTPIHEGARAQLTRLGVTNLRFIDIAGGDPRAPRIEPGSEIPGEGEILQRFAERADVIIDRFESLLADIERLTENMVELTGPENRAAVAGLLERLEGAATEIESTAAAADAMVAEGRLAIASARRELSRSLEAANSVLASAGDAVEETDELIASGRRTVEGSERDVRTLLRDLRATARELRELSRDLRRDPSKILFDDPPEPRELP